MIPNKSLVQPPQLSAYLFPDDLANTFLVDYELGGIGLSDPSQGLEVQEWTLNVLGSGVSTGIYLSAPNTPSTFILSEPYITFARLAFDQNMHPVITFLCNAGSGYYWWDPSIPGNSVVFFPNTSGITYVACSLDDKRPYQTRVGSSDVIMAYVANNNLCYRQQRDRYGIEYVLYVNINNLIPNPLVNKVGMASNYRLQFEIFGNLYQ